MIGRLVPPEGFEPPTCWVETNCSCPSSCSGLVLWILVLCGWSMAFIAHMVVPDGFEPPLPVLHAGALPTELQDLDQSGVSGFNHWISSKISPRSRATVSRDFWVMARRRSGESAEEEKPGRSADSAHQTVIPDSKVSVCIIIWIRKAPPVVYCRLVQRWSRRWDSNPRPPVYKTGALTI